MIWLILTLFILYIVVVYMIIRAFYILNQDTNCCFKDEQETDWDFIKDKQVKDMYKNVRIHKGGKKQ